MYKTHVIDDIFGISALITEQRYRKDLDRFRSLHIHRGLSRHPSSSGSSISLRSFPSFHISEKIIYPGLDGLSRWLQRHYYVKDGEDS